MSLTPLHELSLRQFLSREGICGGFPNLPRPPIVCSPSSQRQSPQEEGSIPRGTNDDDCGHLYPRSGLLRPFAELPSDKFSVAQKLKVRSFPFYITSKQYTDYIVEPDNAAMVRLGIVQDSRPKGSIDGPHPSQNKTT